MHPEWNSEPVAACLVKVPAPNGGKLQTKDYKPDGKYPIIDQSQDLIAGWTDDDEAVISSPLPIIVFGDHTRAFKYVDFPFVRGADGTQLLKPRRDIDALYFFYACRAIDLPSRGYNRHFTVLKEKEIPLPPKAVEQQAIGKLLWRVEKAVDVQSQEVNVAQELKRSAMRDLFTGGLRGEAQKETEIGLVPQSWNVERLDKCADTISTRMPYTDLEKATESNLPNVVTVLGIKVSDMNTLGNEVVITHSALMRTLPLSVAEYRAAPSGTIVFPKRGAAIATNKKRLTSTWTVFDPNIIGVIARDGLDQKYFFHWFQNFDLRTITEPGPTPQLNKKNLDPLLIPVPQTLDEQKEIVEVLDAIDRKIDLHKRKKAVLEELFKSLLHKLMTGEIRVGDLDLSAIQQTEAA